MPTLSLSLPDGTSHSVTVDDSFTSLPPDQQEATVNEIAATLGRTQTGPSSDTSMLGALRYGASNAARGFAATGDVIGHAVGSDVLQQAGRNLDELAGGPGNYAPATPHVAENLKAGHYGEALSYVPRAAAEAAPDMLGALAAAGIGSLPGLSAYLAARSFGENAKARAAANKHDNPTTGDMLAAGATTAIQTGLGAVGLGKVPGVGAALEAVPTAAGRVMAGAGADALAGAAADAVGQVGNTAGTAQGLTVDPATAAASGLIQGAARGGSLASSEAARMTGSAMRSGVGATFATPSVEAAQSIARVNDAADAMRRQMQSDSGAAPTDRAVLDALHRQLQTNAGEIGRRLKDAGAITAEEHRSVLQPAIREAAAFRPDEHSDTGPLPFASALADLSMPPEIALPLAAAIADLATVSAARRSDITGPFEKLGHTTATLGAAGGLLAAGQPVAAVGALLGAKEVSRVGGAVGGLMDRVAGTAAPAVFLRRGQAQSVLRRAGVETGSDAIAGTNAALATLRDPQARLNLSLRLPLDTPAGPAATPPVPDAAQARGLNLAEQAGRTIEQEAVRQALARGRALAAATGQQAGGDADAIRAAMLSTADGAAATTSWKPGDAPVGLQILQAAAQRARLAELADTAERNSVPALARRQVDNAALRAAAALAAEHLAPGGAGAADDTATAAAIALAARRAEAVRRLADGAGDAADRAAVGASLRDPVPVNAPLSADRSLLREQPSVVQTARARAAVRPSDDSQGGAGAAADSTSRSAQAAGGLPAGWMAYVLNALMRNGIAARPADVHGAVDDMVTAGELNETHGAAMKAHSGPVMVPELLQRIASQTARRTGNADRLDAGLAAGQADSSPTETQRGSIRDPERWFATREDRKAHAENLANQAERLGDHELAVTIRKIAAEPTAAGKAKIAEDYSRAIKGKSSGAVLRQARAAQFLSGTLMRGV